MQIRVKDLDIGIALEVGRLDLTRLVRPQIQSLRLLRVQLDRNLLQVQDDIGCILHDTWNRGELMEHLVDLDARDRGTLDGRQEHPAQRVADRRPETALERLSIEPTEPIRQRLGVELQTFRSLEAFP